MVILSVNTSYETNSYHSNFSCPVVFGNVTSAQNLALNKAVTVSSVEGAFTGDFAVDGDLNTRWGSAFNEPEYIQVDLGDVFALDELTLYWEGAYAVRYTVEVSENGANYVTVDDIVNGNGGTDVISLTGNNGRYVRIICTERVVIGGAQYGFSLYEMEVTGSASPSSALLQDITVDGVSLPTFSGTTFYYVQDLWDSLAVIPVVDAVPANPSATYTVTDATSLPGETIIEVTSADMSSMETYTIYFQQSRYNIVWQDEFDYTGPMIQQNGIIRPFHRLTEVGLMVKSNIILIEMRILMLRMVRSKSQRFGKTMCILQRERLSPLHPLA